MLRVSTISCFPFGNVKLKRSHPSAPQRSLLCPPRPNIDAYTFGTDWMTFDKAGQRDSWTEPGDECSAARKVPELLAEQVEAADLLLVNKVRVARSCFAWC